MVSNTIEFIGLDTKYLTADGNTLARLHMDGAASPLALASAKQAIEDLLPHYSNTHSNIHNSARVMSSAFAWAHDEVLRYLDADPKHYCAAFIGSGTTSIINRLARGLSTLRPEKSVVLVSAMEHHSNDLPHRQFGNDVHYLPLTGTGIRQGTIDLKETEKLLKTHQDHVNYLTFSAVSNVTGIVNPADDLTKLAHRYGALVIVDGAQSVAHQDTRFTTVNPDDSVDFFVFSGHKIYCPNAPGVMLAKRALIENMQGQDLGGGAVSDANYFDFTFAALPDREQAGTPNIIGTIALARVLEQLFSIGKSNIRQHSKSLINELNQKLREIENLTVYGDDLAPKLGAITFNHSEIDHGLLAAILNDYYAIAVRSGCFCAHPYVSSLLKEQLWQLDLSDIPIDQQDAFINRKRGMVRASLSLYNTSQDISRLVSALLDINAKIDELAQHYTASPDGSYHHHSYLPEWRKELGW